LPARWHPMLRSGSPTSCRLLWRWCLGWRVLGSRRCCRVFRVRRRGPSWDRGIVLACWGWLRSRRRRGSRRLWRRRFGGCRCEGRLRRLWRWKWRWWGGVLLERSSGFRRLWRWRLLGVAGLVLCLRRPGWGLVLVVLECLESYREVFSREIEISFRAIDDRQQLRFLKSFESMIQLNLGSLLSTFVCLTFEKSLIIKKHFDN